jgi:hypothetical protein
MINKFLEKRVEIETDENPQTEEKSFELEYYLLESDTDENCEKDLYKGYGVEIIKKHHGFPEESKRFVNIFNTRERTQDLVELLANNTVTPSTLAYVLDDLLGA